MLNENGIKNNFKLAFKKYNITTIIKKIFKKN